MLFRSTGENINKAADVIQLGVTQLDATVTALNDLVHKPAHDLGPQFKTFSKNLDQLDSTAKAVRSAAGSMDEKGKAYFADWDKQIAAIQNEDIKNRSSERRQAVEASLSKLQGDYGAARDTFRPLMTDLLDIRTALGSDLTLGGIDAIKNTVEKVGKEAGPVKETLTKVAEEFRKLGVGMSKLGPPPAEPKK